MAFLELIFRRFRPLVWSLVAALTIVGFAGISRLEFVDDLSNLLLSTDATDGPSQAARELAANFGSAEDYCYVIIRADNVLTPSVLGTVDDLRQKISRISGVSFVATILDLRSQTSVGTILPPLLSTRMEQASIDAVSERVLAHPLTYRSFLSADHQTTLLAIIPDSNHLGRREMELLLSRLQHIVDRIDFNPGIEIDLAGWPVVQRDVVYLLRRDQPVFTAVALFAAAIAGWLLFRNVRDLLIMIVPPIFGVIWSHGLLGFIGQDINLLNVVMAPLILVVGFTDSVHMLLYVRREQANGMSAPDAVLGMLRELGPVCVQTSLTTAVGFGSLSIVASPSIRAFGICCALSAGFVLLSVITVLPLMCWHRPATRIDAHGSRMALGIEPSRFALWLQRKVHQHALRITIMGSFVALVLCYIALQSRIDYRFSENLTNSHQAFRSMNDIDSQFGGAMTLQVVVRWPQSYALSDPVVEAAVHAASDCIDQHPMTSNTLSIGTVADSFPGSTFKKSLRWLHKAPPPAVGSIVRPRLQQTLISARVHDLGSRVLHPQLLDLESQLAAVEKKHPGFRFEVAGLTALSIHRSQYMLHELTSSLLLAGGTIFAIIAILFRSLRWGLLAVIPNILPLAAATALLVLVDQPLRFSSLLALTVSLGVVVDDSIHMLWHIRLRLNEGISLTDAVGETQRELFSAFLTTTLLLVIGFGVTLFSQMPTIQLFGAMACCSLLFAFVADLVLLPAMMLVGCSKASSVEE